MADRSALGVGVLTAAATLVGAALGVFGTLLVSSRQQQAAVDAELRTARADAYQAYLDTSHDLFVTQLDYATHEDHCTWTLSALGAPVAEGRDMCAVFNLDEIEPVQGASVDARRDVLIYGSPDGTRAMRELSEYIGISHDPMVAPFSDAVFEVWTAIETGSTDQAEAAWTAAWEGYEAREADLLLVMCEEVSVAPGDCSDFAEDAGAPRPSPSSVP